MYENSSKIVFPWAGFIFGGSSSILINAFFLGRHVLFGGGGSSEIRVVLHLGKYGSWFSFHSASIPFFCLHFPVPVILLLKL